MKRCFLIVIVLFYFVPIQAQKTVTFPYNVKLKNLNGDKVSSKIIHNFGNPILIVFANFEDKYMLNKNLKKTTTLIPSNALFLLEKLNKEYLKFNKENKLKIILITQKEKVRDKNLSLFLMEKKWSFTTFIDYKGKLYSRFFKSPIKYRDFGLIILDGGFNEVQTESINKNHYNSNVYCYKKNGTWELNKKRITSESNDIGYEKVLKSLKVGL